MVRVIDSPRIIPAAGSPPKSIAEYIGRAVSGTSQASIAMMNSPPGWSEPGQIPEFDEYSLVLKGTLLITTRTDQFQVQSGQVAIAQAGEWVQYSSPDGAGYVAICVPAFSPDLAHRDGSDHTDIRQDQKVVITYEEYGSEGLALLEDLWNQLRIHHVCNARHFRDHLQSRSFSERCTDVLTTNEGRELLVHLARDTNKVPIGFCISSAATGYFGEIESIFVQPEYRSSGIGTTFMNRALSWMGQREVTEYRVGICEGNEQSFRFYERFGFYLRRHLLIRRG
ncbi:MAG: GNAT family N-acetyltransferase [Methanospirillum sp.]|uniref:GNAT family N-acetyltransferase n=1 Tax=Methanospirillum sp. TaxID=45200 RepID=UPI00236A585E|nr:GNAT family N-acetyltransferase [Methanospirillum sp.]MDD1729977.1 GNAT family N-acetyltransferase [Methanospirillum sp.]